MSNKKTVMTCVLDGCEGFPKQATVGDVTYKVTSASIYDEIERNLLLENIITKAVNEGIIDDDWLLKIGVTPEEIHCICWDTSVLDQR